MRTFEDKPAVRERVPVLVGLVGPSGGGKTFSALRLATGMQRVTGGEICFIDTEARRALHYADAFRFRHIVFEAPFGPLDYLAAIEHCVKVGARVVIVDSMSHEHEGPGGVLEMHGAEVERLSRGDANKADKVKMLAWQKPKSERRRLLNRICQLSAHFIFCFRAKEKLKIVPGKAPEPRGWQPIAGEEFVFEMTVNALLLPGANGVPTWQPDERAERQMIKLPEFAREWFTNGRPIDEATGESLARWAEGTPARSIEDVLELIAAASTQSALEEAQRAAEAIRRSMSKADQARVRAELEAAKTRIAAA